MTPTFVLLTNSKPCGQRRALRGLRARESKIKEAIVADSLCVTIHFYLTYWRINCTTKEDWLAVGYKTGVYGTNMSCE